MSPGTVDRIVMWRPFTGRDSFGNSNGRFWLWSTNATPHHIQNCSANQWIFNGAGEEERWRILNQCADNVRTTTFKDVMRPFQTAWHTKVCSCHVMQSMMVQRMTYLLPDVLTQFVACPNGEKKGDERNSSNGRNKRKYEDNEERKLCEKIFKRVTSKRLKAYLNDVKCVAFGFRDRKRLKFRVSFLG